MKPTLNNMNVVLIKKYNLNIKNGDIVVIKKKNNIIIKRVIGIPDDEIYIDKYVYVNNKKFDNLYIKDKGNIKELLKLNNNEYFVLGDNRNHSIDSRFDEIGIISKNEIIGKVLFK